MKSTQRIIFCILILYCIFFVFVMLRMIMNNKNTIYGQDYLSRGDSYFDAADYENARKQYIAYKLNNEWNGRQKQQSAEQCISLSKEAKEYFLSKNYELAKSKYQEILRSNPKDPDAPIQILECDKYIVKKNNSRTNNNNYVNVDRKEIENFIQNYNYCIVNNDFQRLSELYAPVVERFHDAYHKDRKYVIDLHKSYDTKYSVYGKRSSVHWGTLQISKNNDLISIQFIQDYSIDSNNPQIYKNFVLEKHINLNKNYQITSIYDKQINKSK